MEKVDGMNESNKLKRRKKKLWDVKNHWPMVQEA
jgi:hypothetical protein